MYIYTTSMCVDDGKIYLVKNNNPKQHGTVSRNNDVKQKIMVTPKKGKKNQINKKK